MKATSVCHWVVAMVLCATGCSDAAQNEGAADAFGGVAHDGAVRSDAGDSGAPADASGDGSVDATGAPDAAELDAAIDDGGAMGDAADFDAGDTPDGGGAVDAAQADAGGDAGTPADAGEVDAGAPDAGGGGTDAGGADASQPVDFPPDKWGRYQVGVINSTTYDAARKRFVPMYFWYPATGPGAKQAVYMGVMKGQAGEDAPAAKADGPFPLVLFSHGFKGIAFQSFSLTEHLASHGFVVAAPNHQGNTLFDFNSNDEDVAKVTMERPNDMAFTYAKAVEFSATAGHALEGTVDQGRVASTGHSFGAFTAIIVAGAESDMDRAKAACAAGVQADIFCDYVPYYAPGTILKMDPQIAGLKALVALAPGGYNAMFDDNLAKVYVPGLVMGGTEDNTCPLDIETRPIYNGMPRPKSKAELTGATHMSFTNVCSIPGAAGIFGEMCQATMTETRAFEIINALTTAYLRTHVNGEAGMEPWLADPYISQSLGEVTWVDDR